MTTKSKWSRLISLSGPSIDALVLVARTTSALVRISVIALSSLCRSSCRKDFISCLKCFFSDGFFDFPTFFCKGNENVKQTTQHSNCKSSLLSKVDPDSVSQNHSPKSGTSLSHLKSLKLARLFFVATQRFFGRKITKFATQVEPMTLFSTVAMIK